MHGVGIHFSDQGSPTGKANMDTLLIHVHIIIEAQFPEYQSYRHQHPNFPFLYIMPCLEWVQHSQVSVKRPIGVVDDVLEAVLESSVGGSVGISCRGASGLLLQSPGRFTLHPRYREFGL